MNKMKYIVIGNLDMFLFPMHINHIDFYKRARRLVEHVDDRECTSAGFVRFHARDGQVVGECYGRSESLNIDSSPVTDNFLLELMI